MGEATKAPLVPSAVIPRLVRGTCSGIVLAGVPRTSRGMTGKGDDEVG
jgi:hypothetical protein